IDLPACFKDESRHPNDSDERGDLCSYFGVARESEIEIRRHTRGRLVSVLLGLWRRGSASSCGSLAERLEICLKRGRRREMPLLRFQTHGRDRTTAGSDCFGGDSKIHRGTCFEEDARALLASTDGAKEICA